MRITFKKIQLKSKLAETSFLKHVVYTQKRTHSNKIKYT